MNVIFAPEARNDLKRIRAHIAQDRPIAATRFVARLLAACDRLETFPEMGRLGKRPDTRELTTVPPYVIVYWINGGVAEILRVWHGRQKR